MSLSSHLTELKKKHETLSFQVERAEKSPSTDRMQIKSLKKQKLALKDEIERLMHS
ncbi:YdcH family protein [Arenibacterium sp. LLYu02]|uniref:YdcH family protein n=1 Tax=Arenibacterium sp. LLYu02 TaxID=3404132 RepID=UPI003B211DEC